MTRPKTVEFSLTPYYLYHICTPHNNINICIHIKILESVDAFSEQSNYKNITNRYLMTSFQHLFKKAKECGALVQGHR